MGYSIFNSDGNHLTTINVKTVDDRNTTSLVLIGQGIPNYGAEIAQDFVWLLENFASATAPAHPMVGQQWYDTTYRLMRYYTGTGWSHYIASTSEEDGAGHDIVHSNGDALTTVDVNTSDQTSTSLFLIGQGVPTYGADIAQDFVWLLENFAKNTAPIHPMKGQEWYDTSVDKMRYYDGIEWKYYLTLSTIIGDGVSDTGAIRTPLVADQTYYVDGTGGNDTTGNGLNSTPWKSLQHAYDFIATNIDCAGRVVTIIQTGVDTAGLLISYALVGSPYINLVLNGSIVTTNPSGIRVFRSGGLNLSGSGSITAAVNGIICQQSGFAQIQGVTFNAVAGTHIYAQAGGLVTIVGNYNIGGDAARHWFADTNSSITVSPSAIVTLINGTRNFSQSFAIATTNGNILADHTTCVFNGSSATGMRYFCSANGGIFTNSGGANYLPGSVAGVTDTLGYYV